MYYDNSENNLYSVNLNGSNRTVLINDGNIEDFAYDGVHSVLYYVHTLTGQINSFNISSGERGAVEALSSVTNIRDLDMDIKNG